MKKHQLLKKAKKNIEAKIKKQNLDFVWKQIEIPLKPICDEMTKNGFKIDKKELEFLSKIFKEKILKLENEIFKISGTEFNIKSTQQLSKILFEKLNISSKGLKKTPKGVISTKESELQKLKGEHEIIDFILEYRELAKMLSTYVDNLIPLLDKDNRLHPTFLQLGTSTGRFSSKNPNIQNIPTSGEYGSLIRKVFIADKDFVLYSFDYSQIELRLTAILSGDEKLTKYFLEKKDIHSSVALEIFGGVTKENRKKAKVINFGILYGMGINSLRKKLNEGSETEISVTDARNYYNNYFDTFPKVATFLENTKLQAKELGFTKTIFGRKRFFPEINSKAPFIRALAERMAINAPIQGSAADIIKLAMISINTYLIKNKLKEKIKIIAQVHDELIFEIDKKIDQKHIKQIEEIMENVLVNEKIDEKYKKVPLKIHVSFGKDWSELK